MRRTGEDAVEGEYGDQHIVGNRWLAVLADVEPMAVAMAGIIMTRVLMITFLVVPGAAVTHIPVPMCVLWANQVTTQMNTRGKRTFSDGGWS